MKILITYSRVFCLFLLLIGHAHAQDDGWGGEGEVERTIAMAEYSLDGRVVIVTGAGMRPWGRTLGRTRVTRKIKKGQTAAFFPVRHYTLAQRRYIGNHAININVNLCCN